VFHDTTTGADDIANFRNDVTSDFLSFGVAYYPWVKTSIVEDADIDYTFISSTSVAQLQTYLKQQARQQFELTEAQVAPDFQVPTGLQGSVIADQRKKYAALSVQIDKLVAAAPAPPAAAAALPGSQPAGTGAAAPQPAATQPSTATQPAGTQPAATPPPAPPLPATQPAAAAPVDPKEINRIHRLLITASPDYTAVMAGLKADLNVLPPSGGIAGVYTMVDNTMGVFKAPANTGMASVVAPCVDITHDEQQDLNVPLDGKAINAIRTFPGRGVLIWGARTLDGNSQDWRYINVRRTLIMLEQSIKAAAGAYVFAPNNASTWVTVSNMISNFLTNEWKAGALVGATPAEAFSVDVGLGSTMTANDILDGYMLVTVKLAVVRPAEFIIVTFQQKMQTS
jgi:hypothetical protein